MKKLTIYSKFCVKCLWPQELQSIEAYAKNNNMNVLQVRTVLDSKLHQIATSLWGNADYTAFVYDGENAVALKQFLDEHKTKPVKRTKRQKPGGMNVKSK